MFAVLLACLRDPRPLDIRTDSEYVRNGVASWQTWHSCGWSGEHADLWTLLADELSTRVHPVTVIWVKGHAKMIDVWRGRTSLADKSGNDGADALAVAGAELHAVDSDIILTSISRKKQAKDAHMMFVEIIKARQAQEQFLSYGHDDVGDRGSDPGDCMAEASDVACDVCEPEPQHLDGEDGSVCMELKLDDEFDDGV